MAILNGGAGNDGLRGTNNADWMYGGAGDDTLSGMGGNDFLFGGSGRDTLDGGSGSDLVDGGLGDDLLIYNFGENRNSHDIYNGGFGNDTLRLVFTAAEWDQAAIRGDVHRFLAYLPEYNEPLGWIDDPYFTFSSFGLAVVGINKLEVVVDGKVIDAADRPVAAADDAVATTENAGVTIDVLANDRAADGVRTVSITQPAKGSVELVSTSFDAAIPSAVIRFVPGAAFDALKAGETATQVFTYTVTDKDGDRKTASVQVTITGTNDAPIAVADIARGSEDELLSGSVALNDTDVDGGSYTYFQADYYTSPDGFSMRSDGAWTFDPARSGLDALAAGETRTVEVGYTYYDDRFASSKSTLTITVTGTNDAPRIAYVYGETLYADEYGSAEPGETLTKTGSFVVADPDAKVLPTVTLLDVPDGHVGTLTLLGYEYGEFTYEFTVDAAIVKSLGEGEEIVQTYQVRIDDGQGGVTVSSFDFTIVGDGNDPVAEGYVDDGDFRQEGGVLTKTTRFWFSDEDVDDVHGVTVTELDGDDRDYIGAVTIGEVKSDAFGDRYVDITFTYPADAIETLSPDAFEQRYEIVISDGNGGELVIERTVTLREDDFYIGGDDNDFVEAYDDNRNTLVGGAGTDILVGAGGRDLLFGDAGPELPSGEENLFDHYYWENPVEGFDDELNGGGGADRLTGGAGADRFVFERGEADGDEVVDFSAADGDRLEFFGWDEGATLTRVDGAHWRIANADGSNAEVITVANGADLTPNDYVITPRDIVWEIGTDEGDFFYGWDDVRYVMIGGGGSDDIEGGDHDDALYGDAGPDLPDDEENLFDGGSTYYGEGSDDTLDGGAGSDLLVGGAGADIFEFNFGEAGGDVVRDFDGAEGDVLDFRAWGLDATFTQLDATHWEIADAQRDMVQVITFENAPTIDPESVWIFNFG